MSDSSAGPFTAFRALLHRDLTIAFRRRGELLHPVFFFLMVITLFPFAIGPDRELLALIAPGVLWVAALLATLLALDRLFRSDHRDGSLEQLLLSPHPLSLLVLAKVLVHWLTTGLPLIVVTPLLAMMLDLPSTAWSTALVSLALGTLTMSLVGAIGSALTLTVKRSSALLTLIVLPLYVPILIFGAGAVQSATIGIDPSGLLLLMAAGLLLALSLAPLAIGAALRVSLN